MMAKEKIMKERKYSSKIYRPTRPAAAGRGDLKKYSSKIYRPPWPADAGPGGLN